MLTTVLERLTSLASKHFIVAAFIPVLVFAFLNGVILYLEFAPFRAWAGGQISGGARVFDAAAVLIGIAIVAHVLWSVNAFLRQMLEGQYIREDSALGTRLRGAQRQRFTALRSEFSEAARSASQVRARTPKWTEELVAAATTGQGAGKNDYDPAASPAGAALNELRDLRLHAQPISVEKLENAVTAFKAVLAQNDIRQPQPNPLSADRTDLLTLFDYAAHEWIAREVARANELQARFGGSVVAPTAFGNVAASMQSYTLSRYSLNLTTFWSRLQAVIQKHEDFYGTLQDAKVQLDFLVASVYLAAGTTAVWLVVLPIWGDSVPVFVAVALLGPLTVRLCYRAAVENHVAFADIVRTSVDLYRFELLQALHLSIPETLRQERALWANLRLATSFGQPWVDVRYDSAARQTSKT
jgi:hypothetical protein